MNHGETAVRLHNESGANCASCVFAAFCDVTGLDRETALKAASSLGGGMGKLGQTCGALSGVLMALGMLCGPTGGEGKMEHYARVHALGEKFQKQCGALSCPELLGPEFAVDKPELMARKKEKCNGFIKAACDILDAWMQENDLPR